MTNRRDLAALIDHCLDEILAGRATVADCLDRYPEQRAALEPLLRAATALGGAPRGATPTPDPARRAALMAEIRTLPQQRRRRRWLPGWPALPTLGGALLPRLAMGAAPIAVAVVLGVLLLVGQQPTPAAASTLTIFGGSAEQQVNGAWTPLTDGARVEAGTRLRTGADGHALLTFPDGSTATLDPGTEISIDQLVSDGPRVVRLQQFSGHLWNDVATDARDGAAYEVRTDDASIEVHGTVFETAVVDGETAVSTAAGNVDVITAGERLTLPPGQQLRARAQQVVHRAAIPATGSLVVNAPFSAALLAPSGEATGASTDGATVRQIRGVITSNPADGPQRFDFQRLAPGDYTLLLHRLDSGGGDLVLDSNGVERRVNIDDQTGTARVQVRVVLQDGTPSIELVGDAAIPAPAAPDPVRVVETARTRPTEDLAAQRKRADRAEGEQTSPPTRVTDPAVTTFAQQLRAATAGKDAQALSDSLGDILGSSDEATVEARLSVLAALLADDVTLSRVKRVLSDDTNDELRARLQHAAAMLPAGAVRARLERALGGKAQRAPRERSTETPSRTPTRSHGERATPTLPLDLPSLVPQLTPVAESPDTPVPTPTVTLPLGSHGGDHDDRGDRDD